MATPPTQKPKRKRTHILELDGVRGIAILLVLIYHFATPYASSQHTFLADLIGLGWSGVDLFFVLSGFLITGILVDTRKDPHYFRNFYIRRALRILPLYYAFLIVFAFIVLPFAHHQHKFEEYHLSQLSLYWVHLSNWSSALGAPSPTPVAQMWSLAIEEQFYFVWPLVVFLLPESILPLICFALAASSIGLRCLPSMQLIQMAHHEFLYRVTPFRIEPICYGALIALFNRMDFRKEFRGWAGVACLIFGTGLLSFQWMLGHTFTYNSFHMMTFGYTAVDFCGAGVVLLALRYSGTFAAYSRILRSSALRTLGKYSYAIYILHDPIAPYIYKVIHHFIGNVLIGSALNVVLGGAVALGLAKLSWMFLESPILSLKDRIAHYRRDAQFETGAEETSVLVSSETASAG
jgi:peptidoglycan/LPS O-acetylase OafA/YrhL